MAIFDFKNKEGLQKKIAEMEREIEFLKLKLDKETADKDLLQKQLSKDTDFDIDRLSELDKYKTKMQEYYSKMLIYQRIIERYREIIESSETVSIPELKSKINPRSEMVQQKLKSFNINYAENPMRAVELAKEFIDTITTVSLNIDFWMSPEDVTKYNVADPMCKAVLLASFISALEQDYKILMCQMSNGEQRPLILVNLEEGSLLLDPNVKHSMFKYYDKYSTVISNFEYDGAKIAKVLYEFNELEYVPHEE